MGEQRLDTESQHYVVLYLYNKMLEDWVAPSKAKIFNRLRILRTERGLSRQEVADAVGVNHQTIGYLEREDYNPSLALAFKLADFYDLPVDVLFSLKPLRPLSETLVESAGQRSEEVNR